MHVETCLLHGVGDVWPRESEILERPDDAAVERRISHWLACAGGELALDINWRGSRRAGRHAGPIEDVLSILGLGQEEASRRALHLNAEKEVDGSKIFHGKLKTELINNLVK